MEPARAERHRWESRQAERAGASESISRRVSLLVAVRRLAALQDLIIPQEFLADPFGLARQDFLDHRARWKHRGTLRGLGSPNRGTFVRRILLGLRIVELAHIGNFLTLGIALLPIWLVRL